MQIYWDLFRAFFNIGLFTFGGGYAMLPMLRREVVQKHGWADDEELLNVYAVAQCTPGVIAVNVAGYVGFRLRRLSGAAIATVAVVLPSILIISVIATILNHFAQYEIVMHAFAGIRVAVGVLVLRAFWTLFRKGVKNAWAGCLFAIALAVSVFTPLSPVWLVLAAAVLGILLGKAGKTL